MKRNIIIIVASVLGLILGAYGLVYLAILKPIDDMKENIAQTLLLVQKSDLLQEIVQMAEQHPENEKFQRLRIPAAYAEHMTDSLYDFTQNLRIELIEWKGQDNYERYMKRGKLRDPGNTETATEMLVYKSSDLKTPVGLELQRRFNRTRKVLISMFERFPEDDSLLVNIDYQLYRPLEDQSDSIGEDRSTWYGKTFYNVPTAAALAILTKLSYDARNAKKIVHQEILRVMSKEEQNLSETQ